MCLGGSSILFFVGDIRNQIEKNRRNKQKELGVMIKEVFGGSLSSYSVIHIFCAGNSGYFGSGDE